MVDNERIRRLVGEDADEDAVEQRLAELDDLDTRASRGMDADLETLGAVGNRTRWHILRLLVADGELTVGELDAVVGVSQSAISHALGDLHEAGLVARRSEGTWRHYRATDAAERLVNVLEELREE
jgi:DNA-binding transcriptional ArsR family regulator